MKHQHFYKILVICILSTTLTTCVDPLNFDQGGNEKMLVVDGRVNAGDSIQTVRLNYTSVVGRSANFPPASGATVSLLENGQKKYAYQETEPGIYQLMNFTPQVGSRYQVDIRLANGAQYASESEMMPRPIPIDSAYFTFNGERTLTLFTKVTIPQEGEKPYLRARIRHVYQHTDQYCDPFDKVQTCYYELERATDNQLIPLLDGSKWERGISIPFSIAQAPVIDSIFGEITYYTILQESISLQTLRYWEKVQRLLAQRGSIFDAPPGQIRGNIYKVDEPEKLVLGLFYASSETIAYVKTYPLDFLPLQLTPYCGVYGSYPNPFPYPECCYCPFGIARPDYWK